VSTEFREAKELAVRAAATVTTRIWHSHGVTSANVRLGLAATWDDLSVECDFEQPNIFCTIFTTNRKGGYLRFPVPRKGPRLCWPGIRSRIYKAAFSGSTTFSPWPLHKRLPSTQEVTAQEGLDATWLFGVVGRTIVDTRHPRGLHVESSKNYVEIARRLNKEDAAKLVGVFNQVWSRGWSSGFPHPLDDDWDH